MLKPLEISPGEEFSFSLGYLAESGLVFLTALFIFPAPER